MLVGEQWVTRPEGPAQTPPSGGIPVSLPPAVPAESTDAGTPDALPGSPPSVCGTRKASAMLYSRCATCHRADKPQAGLNLASPGVKERLLATSSKCNGKPLVVVISGEASGHLFDKLAGPVPGCGLQMPFGSPTPLTAMEIACLEEWFEQE